MNKQKGYTLVELIVTVFVLIGLGLVGFGGYIAWHFIAKFW